MARKKAKPCVNTYANEASAVGMTYGQRQAQENVAKVKIGPIPEHYRKVGERKR